MTGKRRKGEERQNMSSMERPRLRSISAFPVQLSGRPMMCLQDPLRLSEKPFIVSPDAFFIISLFDGNHSILDVQEQYTRKYGTILFSDRVRDIIQKLDSKFLLESETFEQHKKLLSEEFGVSSVRAAFHAGGAYEAEPGGLKEQLAGFFASREGPGELNRDVVPSGDIKGIVAPHIDPVRGGPCYAWAYKEIGERCNADLFVILGTSHSVSKNAFILTTKDFQTPLGIMNTDKDLVGSLAAGYSADLFEDELTHKFEHSIEFQVVFLQYVLSGRKNVEIVPVLCSSFDEMIEKNVVPSELPAVGNFISLLKEAVAQSGRSVCFVAGADLSHVGRRFGDQVSLSSGLLESIRSHDMEMLEHVEQLDPTGFFRSIQEGGDDRRICGLPPIYILLGVIEASQGRMLKYSQAPEPNTESVVSFASLSFS
jgi:AmmeMemoRadiSam system protein B